MRAFVRLLTPQLGAGLCLAIGILFVAGCGPGKGTVTGKVLYKGTALPYGSVQFMSPGGAFVSEIASDGSYSIKDVTSGTSKIAITCQDPGYVDYMKALSAAARDKNAPKPKGNPEDFNKIPTKYTDFATSGLTYEVKSGNQTYDIKLD